MNRVWTEEELEILRRDREAKVPVPVTAAKLGRPVPATYARARLIGTLVQPHQTWDEASVVRLRDLVLADPPLTDKLIAAELGPKGIRVHAISPGPLATRAASVIPEFDELLHKAQEKAPTRSLVSIDDVGVAVAFLAHDAARLITGETLYIDGGYHIID